MRIRLLLLLPLMHLLGAVQTVQGTPPLFTYWITHPLEKVQPLAPLPSSPLKSVDLFAGRNEFEPFQIVLRTDAKDLSGVDIEFSDLRTKEGAEISKKNVTVYLEQFLSLHRESSIEGAAGLWPDPLIPRIDRYENEKRNAFPLTLRRGHSQPIWVEIFVPPTTPPGKYSGSASISLLGSEQFSVPVNLTVWNFVLPSTASLKSSFGLSGIGALKQHRGRYTDDADLYSITRLYAKAALFHRLSIHVGSMVSPAISYDSGKMQLDWRVYDAEIGPFLDGAAIAEGEPLHGAKSTSVDLRTPGSVENEGQQVMYLAEWIKHFQQRNWLDRLFLYLWDEPATADFSKVLQRGRAYQRAGQEIPNLVTIPFNPKLEEVTQIWTPLVNCLGSKPSFEDFCNPSPPREAYNSEIEQGKSLWFYQSCASHGCNIVGGPYFSGWPSYMIDMPGAANRVMQWLAWKFRIEGELYYSMNQAYNGGGDPWTNVFLSGGNGDGTLFYPGRPDRIGGRTHIPIESIRLKLIREGMEDYEYLALLARLSGSKAADEYADRIVVKTYRWESSPEIFLNVRRELGEELHRLAASPPAS
jgi:hypothetical protein